MIRVRTVSLSFASLICLSLLSIPVHAQRVPPGTTDTQAQTNLDPHLKPATRRFESPERFALELRGGPYSVFNGKDYGSFFANDKGPNLGFQLDGIVYRAPKLLYVLLGGGLGYLSFSGNAVSKVNPSDIVSEQTTLSILPLLATATVRVDVLPRRLGIPILLAARVGWEWAHWDTNTGALNNADGWSLGPVISAQLALDLDSFEPGGARALDEEWGINHTYLFGEVFHFAPTAKSLPIGTTSWLIGLGFVF